MKFLQDQMTTTEAAASADIEVVTYLDTVPSTVGDETAYLYILPPSPHRYLSVVVPTDPTGHAQPFSITGYPTLKALVADLLTAGFDL